MQDFGDQADGGGLFITHGKKNHYDWEDCNISDNVAGNIYVASAIFANFWLIVAGANGGGIYLLGGDGNTYRFVQDVFGNNMAGGSEHMDHTSHRLITPALVCLCSQMHTCR